MILGTRISDIFFALSIVCILLLFLIPLNDFAIDILMTTNIFVSILTLFVVVYSEYSLAFSSFPSFLLLLTFFRLSLNIATVRMILTQAHAGYVVQTFGDVVAGGNVFIGLLIFSLLAIVNFIVITKGSSRVAEVAARFALDALPGRQLGIDADVNAGLIKEDEAKVRRDKLISEADFYGAMDGASKFVRGDAIASMLLIFINLIGGIVVGFFINGFTWEQVVQVYFTLTIGDGLATQIPALLVSVATGIVVTRASSKGNLSHTLNHQLFGNPKFVGLSALLLLFLGFIPGMPLAIIFSFALLALLYCFYKLRTTLPEESYEYNNEVAGKSVDIMENILFTDILEVEMGSGLSAIAAKDKEGGLIQRISAMRRQIALELGIVVPSLRLNTLGSLSAGGYVVKIKGTEIAKGEIPLDAILAVNTGHVRHSLEKMAIPLPTAEIGFSSFWLDRSLQQEALNEGYIVTDPLTTLIIHVAEVIREHISEFLNRQETARMIEALRIHAPALVSELIPYRFNLGQITHILKNLLRERISIRDFSTIMEILADQDAAIIDLDTLTERVRQGLGRMISNQYSSSEGTMYVMTLNPYVEELLQESLTEQQNGKAIVVNPITTEKVLERIEELLPQFTIAGGVPVLLTTPTLRPYLKKWIEGNLPRVQVLSTNEINRDVELISVGTVESEVLATL